jgi:prepilin-type N-terminal cleavage/methylation domain-containing protein
MKHRRIKIGFTLVEMVVTIVVFAIIGSVLASAFSEMYRAWQKQRENITILQNSRWAMETVANELRMGNDANIYNGSGVKNKLNFLRDKNNDNVNDVRVWYWEGEQKGKGKSAGDEYTFYRGEDATMSTKNDSFKEAIKNRVELAYGVPDVDQDDYDMFEKNGDVFSFYFKFWSRPEQTCSGGGGKAAKDACNAANHYELKTQIRPRN